MIYILIIISGLATGQTSVSTKEYPNKDECAIESSILNSQYKLLSAISFCVPLKAQQEGL